MEHKQTGVTPRDLEDADPSQFQHLVEAVWDIFEKQICEQAEATKLLKSAAATMASIGNYKQIEEDFNLGVLGEYVSTNDETLPFLATVMSHIHNQLEREDTAGTTGHPICAMRTFLKELEVKFGADDRTKRVVQEIAEMADLAAGNMADGNPEFARMLMEIGDTMRESWNALKDEVEKCIRHARKKNYSNKNMKHVYHRMICKGISSAMNIQEKIDSVSATLDPKLITSNETDDNRNNVKKASSKRAFPEQRKETRQNPENKSGKDGNAVSSYPSGLKKQPSSQISPQVRMKIGTEVPGPSNLKGKSSLTAGSKEESKPLAKPLEPSPSIRKGALKEQPKEASSRNGNTSPLQFIKDHLAED